MDRKIQALEEKINSQQKEIEKLKEQVKAWAHWALDKLHHEEFEKKLDK